jgi:hypothetical protein
MARVALACLLFVYTLGLLAVWFDGMPPTRSQHELELERPTRLRLQCPMCNKAFKSTTALRQHRAALVGRSRCGADVSDAMETGWSGRGPRAAGTAHDLSREQIRLAGLTDSDSESQGSLAGDHGGHMDRSPEPLAPPAQPAGVPDAGPPVAGPPQVCICMYQYVSVCIRMYMSVSVCIVEEIHTDTYRYGQI